MKRETNEKSSALFWVNKNKTRLLSVKWVSEWVKLKVKVEVSQENFL